MDQTPSSLGFFMPAEWEEHESTWVIFPHNENTWPNRLEVVQKVYAKMLANVSTGEKINLLVENNSVKQLASKLIFENDVANKKNVFFHFIPTMDSWIRDCGPTCSGGCTPMSSGAILRGFVGCMPTPDSIKSNAQFASLIAPDVCTTSSCTSPDALSFGMEAAAVPGVFP